MGFPAFWVVKEHRIILSTLLLLCSRMEGGEKMLKTPIPPNASVTETREPITQQEEFEKGAHTRSAVREQAQPGTLADFSALFHLLLSYRMPMTVRDLMVFRQARGKDSYYICPRCQELLEREFIAYCSRCGQCLGWRNYWKAKRKYFKPKR